MADPRWRIQDGGPPFQILNFIASYYVKVCFLYAYMLYIILKR